MELPKVGIMFSWKLFWVYRFKILVFPTLASPIITTFARCSLYIYLKLYCWTNKCDRISLSRIDINYFKFIYDDYGISLYESNDYKKSNINSEPLFILNNNLIFCLSPHNSSKRGDCFDCQELLPLISSDPPVLAFPSSVIQITSTHLYLS